MRLKKQTGNALLFVLIGIALFAALSYTVVRSSRSTRRMSDETAHLDAQQILSFSEKLAGAVQGLMIQNGCLISEINFENSTVGGYVNAGAPVDNHCDVFDSAGGGLSYQAPPDTAIDSTAATASGFAATAALAGTYYFAGNVCVDGIGSGALASCSSDGNPNEELLVIVPYVTEEVCNAVNQMLKRSTMLVDSGGSFDGDKYTGSITDGNVLGANGATPYSSGCYRSNGGAAPGVGYHVYYVLQAN